MDSMVFHVKPSVCKWEGGNFGRKFLVAHRQAFGCGRRFVYGLRQGFAPGRRSVYMFRQGFGRGRRFVLEFRETFGRVGNLADNFWSVFQWLMSDAKELFSSFPVTSICCLLISMLLQTGVY